MTAKRVDTPFLGGHAQRPDATDPAPRTITVDVPGIPAPQGSKKAVTRGRKTVLIEMSKALPAWRANVTERVQARMRVTGTQRIDGPVRVDVTFWLTRPAAARGRAFPHVAPDVDKLARGVLDALTLSGVIEDDARVVDLTVRKRYAHAQTGARVTVCAAIAAGQMGDADADP